MRTIIYVPILHTESDLGSMAGEVRAKFVEAFGQDAWSRRVSAVESMWTGIRDRLCAAPLVWGQVKLYQDGLPICGHEEEIVRQVALAGSRNHKLLLELMDRGATLMGTEDPQLLLREYRRVNEIARMARAGASRAEVEVMEREGDEILTLRDGFIFRRIDATLEQDESGVLLLGLHHRVDQLMEGKFQVQHLIHRLPLGVDIYRQLKEMSHHGT